MPIDIKCSQCGAELTVDDKFGGKKGRCPGCKAVLQIPMPGEKPAQAPKMPPAPTAPPRPAAPPYAEQQGKVHRAPLIPGSGAPAPARPPAPQRPPSQQIRPPGQPGMPQQRPPAGPGVRPGQKPPTQQIRPPGQPGMPQQRPPAGPGYPPGQKPPTQQIRPPGQPGTPQQRPPAGPGVRPGQKPPTQQIRPPGQPGMPQQRPPAGPGVPPGQRQPTQVRPPQPPGPAQPAPPPVAGEPGFNCESCGKFIQISETFNRVGKRILCNVCYAKEFGLAQEKSGDPILDQIGLNIPGLVVLKGKEERYIGRLLQDQTARETHNRQHTEMKQRGGDTPADKRLMDFLFRKKIINANAVGTLRGFMAQNNCSLVTAVAKVGIMQAENLAKVLAQENALTYEPSNILTVADDVLTIMEPDAIRSFLIAPLSKQGGKLRVAVANPLDLEGLNEAAKLTGIGLEPIVCTENCVVATIDKYWPPPAAPPQA